MLDMSEEEWDFVLDTDLKSVFLCTQAVAKHMIKNKYGKIINIASSAAAGAVPNAPHYASAKAGVVAFTKIAAFELGKYGIYVNAVSPSATDTEMMQRHTPEEIDAILNTSILKRLATPLEIANVVLFLACDESNMITAQNILADGGSYRYLRSF